MSVGEFRSGARALCAVMVCLLEAACGDAAALRERASDDPPTDASFHSRPDAAPEGGTPDNAAPRAFCGRAHDDVALLFCDARAPEVRSLAELKMALDLDRAIFLGHSTGLDGRLASPINPRAVFLRPSAALTDLVAATFTRGAQHVELVAMDEATQRLNFYLLEFEQTCNDQPGGCTAGDRFTPAIEKNWLDLRVRDDEELKNTPHDCRRCHGGAPQDGGKPMLLMRELDSPWLHWFSAQLSTLQEDLRAAKGSEPYADVTMVLNDPIVLENVIGRAQSDLGQPRQPLLFSSFIALETMEFMNVPPLRGPGADDHDLASSPTWRALYDAYLSGLGPAPPYHHERITDPEKLASVTESYRAFLSGRIAKDELLDVSDVLPDDPRRLAEMSFAVDPDAAEGDLLLQSCGDCHNASLDQTLSRARFDADLSRVRPEALQQALVRLELPEDDPGAMPPPGSRSMSSEQRQALIAYLRAVDPASVPPRSTLPVAPPYALRVGFQVHEYELPRGTLAIADLTADGRPDLVEGGFVYEQLRDGTLADAVPLAVMPLGRMAFVDVDGDHHVDIVSYGSALAGGVRAHGLLTFISMGDLNFAPAMVSDGPEIDDIERATFMDVDLDGHIDLVSRASAPSYGIVVYRGDGRGGFAASQAPLEGIDDVRFSAIELADMTGDGLRDLVLLEVRSPPTLAVYAHDGVAGFEATAARHEMSDDLAGRVYLTIGDADSDGLNDIVVAPQSAFSVTRPLFQDADGGFTPGPMIGSGEGPVQFAHMDWDGRIDLVSVITNRGELLVRLQSPLGLTYGESNVFRLPSTPGSVLEVLAVADLDSDACPDVVTARSGLIVVFYAVACGL